MKKILLSIFMLSALGSIQAQDRFEEAANFAADYMCNCINKVYSGVEPEIRDLIIKIYTLPADEQMEFVMGLGEEKQLKIVEQSAIMTDETKAAELDECNNKMVSEIEKKFADIEESEDFNENTMISLMLDRLSLKKKCEFAYMLMKIGMEQPENFEEEIIEENNSDGGEEGQ